MKSSRPLQKEPAFALSGEHLFFRDGNPLDLAYVDDIGWVHN